MEAPGVCCERCPEATLANTRHIARRRLLKAAVFRPGSQAASRPELDNRPASHPEPDNPAPGHLEPDTPTASHPEPDGAAADAPCTWPPGHGGTRTSAAGLAIPRQPAPQHKGGGQRGPLWLGTERHQQNHAPQYMPAAAYGGTNLFRAVTGEILDISPQVVVIGEGSGERRIALAADTRAWRGSPLEPAALNRGDVATIRLLPNRTGVADRIWANIGRVTGTIVGREGDRLLVAESRTKPPSAVVIPAHARVKVQVRYPNLEHGYLLDIIGVRRADYLEGLHPASPQPNYRSDLVPKDLQPPGRMADSIAGSAIWHDFADEPYGVLGVSYPAVDPAAACREDSIAGYPPGQAPAFRDLPYLAVGSALTVRNECTGISCTLPVTGCAPMARLFNDRCVACANSPRGRVADLTVASFVALGGELDEGCFSTTLTIGR